ncbi:PAAR domain-containing protein [Myxococcota bacterium]
MPPPAAPAKPRNALHALSESINAVVCAPMQAVNLLNEGFAVATQSVAAVCPSLPAATLGSLAVGLAHAHPLHPPSGPAPVPPTPIPPVGSVLFGTCVSVLIGGRPAARCGDLGLNPTCCGIPPIFEVFTGSSNVFIGGARAARMTDVTFHCKPIPPAGAANRGLVAAMRAMSGAAKVAQVAAIAGDAIEAGAAAVEGNAAMAQAMGLSAAMGVAQMANDAIATAMGAAMGKDVCVPPGTLGAITLGVPNVLIGGFPMPSWMNVAKGMMKLVKGIRRKAGRSGRGRAGAIH